MRCINTRTNSISATARASPPRLLCRPILSYTWRAPARPSLALLPPPSPPPTLPPRLLRRRRCLLLALLPPSWGWGARWPPSPPKWTRGTSPAGGHARRCTLPGPVGWDLTAWASFHTPWSRAIWPLRAPGGAPSRPAATMLACAPPRSLSASPWAPPPGISPRPIGWDPAALATSFNAMTPAPLVGPHWVADSRATFHTTPDPSILSSVHPPSSHPSSIMVANGSCLHVTSVGAACAHCSFCLPDVLVASSMVHNLLSIRRFTADNSCSVEFDSSGLTVKDLASRRPLLRCDSTGPLYTLQFPTSVSSSSPPVLLVAFATTPSSTTWHRHLGHPGRDALTQLSHSSDILCPRAHDEHLCHACQLGRHVCLPFYSSSSRATRVFDLIHCDLWTSPVLSISGR